RERLSIRIAVSRLEKLRRIAKQKEKRMTQLVEDWIDKLKEEKPSSEGLGFRPSFSVKSDRVR
ncbi:hypothetical protein QT990_13735, partial [Microcoleus sp. T3_B1]